MPNEALTLTEVRVDGEERRHIGTVYPRNGAVAALLAKAVDRVDTLLEDWYPDLGVRLTSIRSVTMMNIYYIILLHCITLLYYIALQSYYRFRLIH